jgi:hypothetical protein
MWHTTRQWRRARGVSTWRRKPQPHFDVLKGCLEHYLCGVDRCGRPVEVVVLNAPQRAFQRLANLGVSVDAAVDHATFLHELLWRQLFPSYDVDPEDERDACSGEGSGGGGGGGPRAAAAAPDDRFATLKLVDVRSLGLWDLGGKSGEYFRKMQALNRHYPERMWRTLVLNAPAHFSLVWRAVEPLLEPQANATHCSHGPSTTLNSCLVHFPREEVSKTMYFYFVAALGSLSPLCCPPLLGFPRCGPRCLCTAA